MTTPHRVLLFWSSGKDSAWALHVLQARPDVEVVALVTTFDEDERRVGMHAVRRVLVEAQAAAAGLPLMAVDLPWPCPNEVYEARLASVFASARVAGVTHVAWGDLFLEDIRTYRERGLAGTGLAPLFPLWHPPGGTAALANTMIASGLEAVVTCVDTSRLPASFVGRSYDAALLAELPDDVDPCGERGAFHTFCHGGPMFDHPIAITVGVSYGRGDFWCCDLVPRLD